MALEATRGVTPKGGLPVGTPPTGPMPKEKEDAMKSDETSGSPESLSSIFQSKSFCIPGIASTTATNTENDLVLVASLVDSPFNLGGLSRVSEIFACSELHLADLKVIKDRNFTSVSMTSELHLPIVETKPDGLAKVLQQQKSKGFKIVGIEQTDSSTIAGSPDAKFPSKAVFVLGGEKFGLPAEVLAQCDDFVEIQQFGQTRSLNVQTAAAVILYEWRKQHG
jgi:tRNA guanosine-2'-O-methyltransferase